MTRPLARLLLGREPAPAPERPDSPERTADDSDLRVMVVDDSADFRESLVALLAAGGVSVVAEAESGAEAIALAERIESDVIVMDIRMPGMDGIEATRRLKARRPSTVVLALTAQEDQQVVRDMLVAGAAGYVLKDADGDAILDAVHRAAAGGGVLSPGVTPTVIQQLNEALERERRRARDLEEAHRELVERVRRRHELIARIGHELRTPVTVVLGLARTLDERTVEGPERDELLERLVSRATALARLVERFDTAMEAAAEDPLDVTALAHEALTHHARVRVFAAEDLPPAWANRVLARRVLEELVDNALKFSSPADPVDVRIGAGAAWIEVRVADRGRGVPHGDRERIFEPLEQAEPLDVRVHPGAGVGLSLGRAAARAMDGDLVLEDTGPTGSVFLWTVPIQEAPSRGVIGS